MAAVEITSFGYLHGAPPSAHLTVDLREHFRDPHVSPELRELTAADERVQRAVMGTSGVKALIRALGMAVIAYMDGTSAGPVRVAVGCAGGRHRAPMVADVLATAVETAAAVRVAVVHRDLSKPVVARGGGGR